jgi:hypothetical protein
METQAVHSGFRSRWWTPLFALFLGGVMLAAMWIGGDPRSGVYSFFVLAGVGALFLFGGRSETLRGIGGPGRDERLVMIDLRATAFAGLVAITAVIGGFLWEVATGGDGSPYAQIGAVSGVAYVGAVAVLRSHS